MISSEDYKVGKCIGSGKEGNIYRALDLEKGLIVAIKKIPAPETDQDKRNKMEVVFSLSSRKSSN